MPEKNPSKIKVDFHCHTEYSVDCLVKLEDIIKERKRKGLDRIAITDHGNIEGALIAKEMDPDGIIVGQEIKTRQGELIAYFVKEEISEGMGSEETVQELKKQGAFISVPHPFDRSRGKCWTEKELEKIIDDLDALEGFNSRVPTNSLNIKAMKFAKEHGKDITVGSDAHSTYEIGRSYLILDDFSNADELRHHLIKECEKFDFQMLSEDVKPFLFNTSSINRVEFFADYIKTVPL